MAPVEVGVSESGGPARVGLIALGGTIASTGPAGVGISPQLSAAELVSAVPEVGALAHLETHEVRRVPSGDLSFDDVHEVARTVALLFADGVEGVVVTQGTDTIEETAFALDLLVDRGPVVVTGAMRPPGAAGADGPANLLAAVRVASSTLARDLGVVVALNDQVHAARWVRKVHTTSPSAFSSPDVGPIGEVVEGRFRLRSRPPGPLGLATFIEGPFHPVALITIAMGDDDRLIGAIGALGYRGVVVEALGGGHVPAKVADALGTLARDVPVVYSSRAGSGSVLTSTYGFAGSETDLVSRGLIPSGSLNGPKARVLLSVLLAARRNADEVREAFSRHDEVRPN